MHGEITMKVTDILTFLDARGLGETDFKQAIKSTYKYTDCGAWLREVEGGIQVGSIVEGVDQGTESHTLLFPFDIKEYWDALQKVEDEASRIWDETHGCEQCGDENEFGYIPVNPDCPNCEGAGIVI